VLGVRSERLPLHDAERGKFSVLVAVWLTGRFRLDNLVQKTPEVQVLLPLKRRGVEARIGNVFPCDRRERALGIQRVHLHSLDPLVPLTRPVLLTGAIW
jgi:hypothetical protein